MNLFEKRLTNKLNKLKNPREEPTYPPPPVNSNMKKEKVQLSDDTQNPNPQDPTTQHIELKNKEIGPSQEETPQQIKQQDLQQPGLPSGSKYSIDKAQKALNNVLKNWMDLSGNFPEGEERHKFMEIGERLREIVGVLNRDFPAQQQTAPAPAPAPVREAIEGLPDTSNPYLASDRPELEDTKEKEQEQEELSSEIEQSTQPPSPEDMQEPPEPQPPPEPTWQTITLPNKQDIGLERKDGFKLRIRQMKAHPEKWVAQLWSGNKKLDSGFIKVPPEEDPTTFITKVADYTLDKNTQRYAQQKTQTTPVQDYGTQEKEPNPTETPESAYPSEIEIEDGAEEDEKIKKIASTL